MSILPIDHDACVVRHLHSGEALNARRVSYNQVRTHLSLENTPDFRHPQKLGPIAAISILGGLHHQYVRV